MTRPMTLTEKILAAHAGREDVRPGELLTCKVDLLMGNDITAPLAIRAFEKIGAKRVFDPQRLALVLSHFAPAKDIRAAIQCRVVRDFAKRHSLPLFFDEGRGGIEHALLPERGLISPGQLILGADSHSCTYGGLGCFSTGVGSTDLAAAMVLGETWLRVPETIQVQVHGELPADCVAKDLILEIIGQLGVDGASYRALEFTGSGVEALSIEGRLTLCNMAIEAGAKNGVVAADELTAAYLAERGAAPGVHITSDPDAEYCQTLVIDAAALTPRVACPPSPDKVVPVAQVSGTAVDQVFIGSCTNGRIEDLRIAAGLMEARSVAPGVRCIVIPATQDIFEQAIDEGLISIFARAGCQVGAGTCGPCLGGHHGVLGENEVCLSTSNRNFPGRMGHVSAPVYLAGPGVAAATAILGYIAHPSEVAALPMPTDSKPRGTHV